MKSRKPSDLREACVAEALAIIGEQGVEGLSIREVARRLGVSHQAPYKHFPSSEHLLAELVRRTYVMFGDHLDHRARGASPSDDMRCMGEAYFGFAANHPLHYRLLFGTPLPNPSEHPEMMHEARKAFALLLEGVARMRTQAPPDLSDAQLQLDALFVWSVVHGLASLMQTAALHQIGLDRRTLTAAMPHVLTRIGHALSCEAPAPQAGPSRPATRRRAARSAGTGRP